MIGRQQEQVILNEALTSKKSELIAIYGRRRVGKTFLIREHYAKQKIFENSGLFKATLKEQLANFTASLNLASPSNFELKTPTSWFQAFEMLKSLIINHKVKTKKVIFLDELPWMATPKSRFLTAFEGFWNGWASARKDLVVVICGSATSWMIKKIEKSKGGLYNRVTKRMVLKPFTLAEIDQFFKQKNIVLNRRHLTEVYMGLGGVPHYLDQVQKGETPEMIFSRLILNKDGILHTEFENVFDSLFGEKGMHKTVMEIIAKNRYGVTRETLIANLKVKSGGWFTDILEELEASGFIESQVPFAKKTKDARIRVIDNYSLYYLNFRKTKSPSNTVSAYNTQEWKIWSGLTFENICMYHTKNIVKKLGLSGIKYSVSTWHNSGNVEMKGAQIDLVIDRGDKAINICEIKFNEHPFVITKNYAFELRTKMAAFNHFTKNKKTLFCTFITAGGIAKNEESQALIQSEIVIDDLFTEA
jgi:uncharacterized protein